MRKPVFCKVRDLHPGSIGPNLVLKVVGYPEIFEIATPYGFDVCSNCYVGDETGVIQLHLTGKNTKVAKKGATLVVHNAQIILRDGFLTLEVGKFGKITESVEEVKFRANEKLDMSSVEYDMVRIDD